MKIIKRKNNECYLGNPTPGVINGEAGTADIWDNIVKVKGYKKSKIKKNKINKLIVEKNLYNNMIDKKDAAKISMLIEKYGAKTVKNKINEAFKSSKMNKYAKDIEDEHRSAKDVAVANRKERMDQAYKYHYKGDVDKIDGIHVYPWSKGKADRDAYEYDVRRIQQEYDTEIDSIIPNFKDLFKIYGMQFVDWSRVEDIDFTEYDIPQAALKFTRGNYFYKFIVFWEDENGKIAAITHGTDVIWARGIRRHVMHSLKAKDILDNLTIDKAYVVNVKNKNNRHEIRYKRQSAQQGMLLNTPEQNAKIIANNIERYKSIIAKNNISKFDDVDRNVRNAMKDIYRFIGNEANFDDNFADIEKLQKLSGNLLSEYKVFLRYKSYVENEDGTWFNTDKKISSMNEYRKTINVIIGEIDIIIYGKK